MATLKCFIEEAVLEHDVNMFLDMCPNYVIEYKDQKIKGDKAYGGGKNPKWTDFKTINHTIKLGKEWERIRFRFDNESDYICDCEIEVAELVSRTDKAYNYELYRNKKKNAGHFKMRVEFTEPEPEVSKRKEVEKPAIPVNHYQPPQEKVAQ
mmetsp:Transcript_34979/g.53695  ORF Transcript_34979/g.53695 Transcript_34979/m.53695 type:complete len:152 (-) Transcript_34979:490-945(-)